jgi:hypothetical protein
MVPCLAPVRANLFQRVKHNSALKTIHQKKALLPMVIVATIKTVPLRSR